MLARTFNTSMYKNILLLLTFFILHCNYAQEIPVNVRDEYLENIKNEMWDIFQNYGLSNLPVPDFQVNYTEKEDYYGYKMWGNLYLEDGFVLDASNFELDERGSAVQTISENFTIAGKIDINKLVIFQDFRIDFVKQSYHQDKANGSVILKPNRLFFTFRIVQNLKNLDVKSYLTFVKNINPDIEFNPDNPLTSRVNKLSFHKTNKLGVIKDLCSKWEDVFNGFLKEAVARCQFPVVKFRTKKN